MPASTTAAPPPPPLLLAYGAALIAECAAALAAPPQVAPTASVLFHRYCALAPFTATTAATHTPAAAAAAALYVALKVEEAAGAATARRLIQVMARREARWVAEARRGGVEAGEGVGGGRAPPRPPLPPPPPPLELWSRPYEAARAGLVAAERRLLVALGFNLRVEAPHGPALQACAHALAGAEAGWAGAPVGGLSAPPPGALASDAWALCNASLRTPLCLRHGAPAIACGAVWLAARRLAIPLPERPRGWWELHRG